MGGRGKVCILLTIFSLVLFLPSFIVKGEDKLSEGEIKQKINKLQVPFIANEGQTDERVGFYAHISGGSVFVTKTGEIVYSLTDSTDTKSNQFTQYGYSSQDNPSMAGYIPHDTQCNFNILHHTCYGSYQNCSCYYLKRPDTHSEDESSVKGLALKEEIIGGKVAHVKGEGRAVTKVSYFQGNDTSQWKNNISTYETVNLGEVYEGIELKLKAYGNNVEKLFYVKPNADPGVIEVKLSGAEALSVNEEGQLEVKTELGPVKFTKPIAYQEIDGKRVEVAVEYSIQKTEDRRQKTEDRRQKTEDRRQKTEDRTSYL